MALIDELLGRYADAYAATEARPRRAGLRRPRAATCATSSRASPAIAAAYARALRARDGRRVPGHQPRAARAARHAGPRQRLRRRRRAAVDLRLPPRRRRDLPRAPRRRWRPRAARSRWRRTGAAARRSCGRSTPASASCTAPGTCPSSQAAPTDARSRVVELLLTSRRVGRRVAPPTRRARCRRAARWRQAEARLVAQRIADLVLREGVGQGDVVVLLRGATDMGLFERAIEEHGLATLASGRPRLLGAPAGARPVRLPRRAGQPARRDARCSDCSPRRWSAQRRRARAHRRWRRRRGTRWDAVAGRPRRRGPRPAGRRPRRRWRPSAAGSPSERAVAPAAGPRRAASSAWSARTGYDLHVLGLPGGRRRLANVQKLMRLAAAFEARGGRDVRGLIDLATAELEAESREPDAPVELGDEPAVRLMTIHAAKGLEFPVVVVADLGREGKLDHRDLFVRGDRVGLRVAVAGRGQRDGAGLRRAARRAARRRGAEEHRVFHVAHDARQGAADPQRRRATSADWQPTRARGARRCLWLAPRLVARPGRAARRAGGVLRRRCGAGDASAPRPTACCAPSRCSRARPRRSRPRAPEHAPRAAPVEEPDGPARARLRRADAGPAPSPRGRPRRRRPACRRRLSFSGLSNYAECPYRWYLRRVAAPARDRSRAAEAGDTAAPPTASTRSRAARSSTSCSSTSTSRAPAVPADDAILRARRRPRRRARRRASSPTCARSSPRSSTARWPRGCSRRRRVEQGGGLHVRHRRARPAAQRLRRRRWRPRPTAPSLVVDYKTNPVARRATSTSVVERSYAPPAGPLRARGAAVRRRGGRGRLPVPRAPGRARRRRASARRRRARASGRCAPRRRAGLHGRRVPGDEPPAPGAVPHLSGAAGPVLMGCRISAAGGRRRRCERGRPAAPGGARPRSISALSSAPKRNAHEEIHSHSSSTIDRAGRAVGRAVAGEVLDVDAEADRRDDPHERRRSPRRATATSDRARRDVRREGVDERERDHRGAPGRPASARRARCRPPSSRARSARRRPRRSRRPGTAPRRRRRSSSTMTSVIPRSVSLRRTKPRSSSTA